jgi:hypothetical protein
MQIIGYAISRRLRIGIALLILGAIGWFAYSKIEVGKHGQWGQPRGTQSSPLNPHGFPKIKACKSISLDDPAREARENISRGDLRPFTVYGFTQGDVPGVFCPSGSYALESRGGTFVSDMPDACGGRSFSNAPADKMEAYNRTLASNPRFQQITGCRPSTYCEERYRKGYSTISQRDPKCPAEPRILIGVAASGSAADLKSAIADFSDRSPKSRDALTAAFIASFGRARWENAELLLRAGADVNGRAFDTYPDKRKWLGSPLEALFNQNGDKEQQIERARWLFAHGADFSNPGSHQALTWAASSNDIDAVNFLLSRGASPNGTIPKNEQDHLALEDIETAGGGYDGRTPFYQAIGQAADKWARQTPEEAARADAERRKGRINAVTLYKAGGRFVVGSVYDELRRKPDIKVTSILLAAAHREGRMKDLIDRILYPNGRDAPFNSGASEGERALVAYLREVASCEDIKPVPMEDHVKLCRRGKV